MKALARSVILPTAIGMLIALFVFDALPPI